MVSATRNGLFSIAGKTALVTGASSGIGEQFAIDLAKDGANVIVAARRADKLEKLVEHIAELAKSDPSVGKAVALSLDVSAGEEAIAAAVEKAWPLFGRIDILVNNAGIFRGGPVLEHSEKDFRDLFDTNVTGLWLVAKAVGARQAADSKGGSIINIGSCIGVTDAKLAGAFGYIATKHAVRSITESLALELGVHKIRVNAIAPGLFPTEMSGEIVAQEKTQAFFKDEVPLSRWGDVNNDLYGPLLLLASDAGAWMTGSYILVDGGSNLMLKNFF